MKLVQEVEKGLREEQRGCFREFLIEKGWPAARAIPTRQQDSLLDICPDPELLATAVMMEPRPQWVIAIMGRSLTAS